VPIITGDGTKRRSNFLAKPYVNVFLVSNLMSVVSLTPCRSSLPFAKIPISNRLNNSWRHCIRQSLRWQAADACRFEAACPSRPWLPFSWLPWCLCTLQGPDFPGFTAKRKNFTHLRDSPYFPIDFSLCLTDNTQWETVCSAWNRKILQWINLDLIAQHFYGRHLLWRWRWFYWSRR